MPVKLYQQVADEIRDLIQQGTFLPGDKLESIRQMATRRQISVSTVQRALEELEMRGLVEAKPKSGYYVRMPTENAVIETPVLPMMPKPVTIHAFASQIFERCERQGVANLGTSYPAADFFPVKQLQQIASRLVKTQMPGLVEVHFSAGDKGLRQAISKRMQVAGCRVTADDILVTNGCLEALSLCLKAVAKPGDTIAVESPGFVGLLQLIESLGYQALEIPCHPTDGISLEALELALEQWPIKAVALVPSFSNPLGSNMPEANRKKLVELITEHEIPLIEDELFADMAFNGARPKPCKAFDTKGLVLHCASVSKTIASGLRIGWIAAGAYAKEVAYFKTFSNISPPVITQKIVAEFIGSGKYDRFLRQFTAKLAQRMFSIQQLVESRFPEGTLCSKPQGGGILWVVLPKGISGLALFEKALDANIAIIPGQLSTATGKFDHCIRLNCACSPDIGLEDCIGTLADIAKGLLTESIDD